MPVYVQSVNFMQMLTQSIFWRNRIFKKNAFFFFSPMKRKYYRIFKSVCTMDKIYFDRDRTKIANVLHFERGGKQALLNIEKAAPFHPKMQIYCQRIFSIGSFLKHIHDCFHTILRSEVFQQRNSANLITIFAIYDKKS